MTSLPISKLTRTELLAFEMAVHEDYEKIQTVFQQACDDLSFMEIHGALRDWKWNRCDFDPLILTFEKHQMRSNALTTASDESLDNIFQRINSLYTQHPPELLKIKVINIFERAAKIKEFTTLHPENKSQLVFTLSLGQKLNQLITVSCRLLDHFEKVGLFGEQELSALIKLKSLIYQTLQLFKIQAIDIDTLNELSENLSIEVKGLWSEVLPFLKPSFYSNAYSIYQILKALIGQVEMHSKGPFHTITLDIVSKRKQFEAYSNVHAIHKTCIRHLKEKTKKDISIIPKSILGRGTFGQIFDIDLALEPRVLKSVFDINDVKAMNEGAILIRGLYFDRLFTRVDWLLPNGVIMEKASFSLETAYECQPELIQGNLTVLAKNLTQIVASMHSRNVLICDMSTRNFLLFRDHSFDTLDKSLDSFKLCDFDSAVLEGKSHESSGTYMFLAPEMYSGPSVSLTPTKASNVWSMGVILLYMLTRKWFSRGDYNLLHVRTTLRNLRQAEIDRWILSIAANEGLAKKIGTYSYAYTMMFYSVPSAQEEVIAFGKASAAFADIEEKYTQLIKEGREEEAKSELYQFSLAHMNSMHGKAHIQNIFATHGQNKRIAEIGAAQFDREILQHGVLELKKIVSILQGCLRIAPEERVTADSLFRELYETPSMFADKERPSEAIFSLFELATSISS